jgi:hypothetical protein
MLTVTAPRLRLGCMQDMPSSCVVMQQAGVCVFVSKQQPQWMLQVAILSLLAACLACAAAGTLPSIQLLQLQLHSAVALEIMQRIVCPVFWRFLL